MLLPSFLPKYLLQSLWNTLSIAGSQLKANKSGLKYTPQEILILDKTALNLKCMEELYIEAYILANVMDRSYGAILKQLGDRVGIFYANVAA